MVVRTGDDLFILPAGGAVRRCYVASKAISGYTELYRPSAIGPGGAVPRIGPGKRVAKIERTRLLVALDQAEHMG
jgi:hypothetical protein